MEKIVKINALFDTYGKLLSKKQQACIKAYYYEDLSLNEIAENEGKSKQAISDLINRSQERLFEFEDELSLLKKNETLVKDLEEVRNLIRNSKAEEAVKALDEIIERI